MKTMYVTILAIVLTGIACIRKTDTKDYCKGVYVYSGQNEVRKISDTLFIQPLSGNAYVIVRKASVKFNKGGKRESLKETWAGIYDSAAEAIIVQKSGRVITFNIPKGQLLVGTKPYIKLADL